MEDFKNSSSPKSELQQVGFNNTSWLTSVENEMQAFLGFGVCVVQGAMGVAQMFAQSEISVAKIHADAKTITSKMPLIHEEIKRLGTSIDKFCTLLLDKYSAPNLTSEQYKEKGKLEEMMKKDQMQLNNLLQYAMTSCKMS